MPSVAMWQLFCCLQVRGWSQCSLCASCYGRMHMCQIAPCTACPYTRLLPAHSHHHAPASLPLQSLQEVRGLVRQAEQRIASLAAALGLPPSQAPTAGAAAAAAVRDPAAEVQQLEQPAAAAAAAAAAAGAGPGSESPAVGESGATAADAAAMATDHSASGATSMEREQAAQQEQEQREQQEVAAQQVAAVDVVAASGAGADVDPHAARRPSRINSAASDGSDRPGLKRDRSKVYAPVAKRRERDAPRVLKTTPAQQAQPASSGSSMQASGGAWRSYTCSRGPGRPCYCHAWRLPPAVVHLRCCHPSLATVGSACSLFAPCIHPFSTLPSPPTGVAQRGRHCGRPGGQCSQRAAAHHHAAHQGGAAAVEGAAGGWVGGCMAAVDVPWSWEGRCLLHA